MAGAGARVDGGRRAARSPLACRRERCGRGAAGGLRCCDRDQSAARPSRSGLRLRRPARATTDCRLDGVAQSPAGGVARGDAAALDRAAEGGGGRGHHRGGDCSRRTPIYEPRPPARPGHTAYRPVARLVMTALAVSNGVLRILGLVLSAVVLALVRQLGVLHERIAPAGALMLNRGPAVGEPAPVLEVADLEGHAHQVGAARADGRSTLLLFVSPTCPVCKSLLPAVKSSRKDERAWMDVILAR